ncbi:putative quinol monooxygenase [Antarcticimicrobium luteum]|uniref:Antibiotic biosynthesis monooxygenase n=1 Tax=Antarcticimicrobium luteum TaxID=2547397 RepID=A0A4V3ASJ6_9RHOB|nr:putative quinol monooxygenase [Antarcticimicrobium luteum]TDK50821.1 antibiotic biosynthesis monooxygenase [Antarcticimicrobium luteum]
MLIVTGTFEVDPSQIEGAKLAMITMMQATRAEPGCLTYDFSQQVEVPHRFRVYEEWEDAASLDAHRLTPHMAAYRATMGQASVGARALWLIEAGEKTALG